MPARIASISSWRAPEAIASGSSAASAPITSRAPGKTGTSGISSAKRSILTRSTRARRSASGRSPRRSKASRIELLSSCASRWSQYSSWVISTLSLSERVAQRAEVQRLAVHDHPVEVENGRAQGHGAADSTKPRYHRRDGPMNCPSCRAQNESSARVCFACGAALDAALALALGRRRVRLALRDPGPARARGHGHGLPGLRPRARRDGRDQGAAARHGARVGAGGAALPLGDPPGAPRAAQERLLGVRRRRGPRAALHLHGARRGREPGAAPRARRAGCRTTRPGASRCRSPTASSRSTRRASCTATSRPRT